MSDLQPGKYYVYAVIDTSTSPATLLAVRGSRQDAKNAKDALWPLAGEGANYRVRRAKLTLFET